MTSYDTMPAGREMDALIALKVMGFKRVRMEQDVWADISNKTYPDFMGSFGGSRTRILDYSTSISAAWEVAEKLMSKAPDWTYRGGPEQTDLFSIEGIEGGGGWRCTYHFLVGDRNKSHWELVRSHAPTAPLAICRAALEATTRK